MFDNLLFDTEVKESIGQSLTEIAIGLKFKNPEKVFPVLQIRYCKMGKEVPAPESVRNYSPTVTLLDTEAVVYLLKSEDEYYCLSLTCTPNNLETDGKVLGKFHEEMLKKISPNIPMTSIAYGNTKCSINFNTVNVGTLFFNPLNTQADYEMDCITGFHKEDITGFVKNFAV